MFPSINCGCLIDTFNDRSVVDRAAHLAESHHFVGDHDSVLGDHVEAAADIANADHGELGHSDVLGRVVTEPKVVSVSGEAKVWTNGKSKHEDVMKVWGVTLTNKSVQSV